MEIKINWLLKNKLSFKSLTTFIEHWKVIILNRNKASSQKIAEKFLNYIIKKLHFNLIDWTSSTKTQNKIKW